MKKDSSLNFYLLGTGSWFFAHGIQNVMFAWLVTMVLLESPRMIGIAQMSLLLPATLFMLVGGSVADMFGAKKVALAAQIVAVIPPVILSVTIATGALSFSSMISYAVSIGVIQAFVTPARDGLLNMVANGNIQRTVFKVTLMQFTIQLFGFGIAGMADTLGAVIILLTQAFVIGIGAFGISRIQIVSKRTSQTSKKNIGELGVFVIEGFRTVWKSSPMRAVVIQNVAMGVCFMGTYIVTIPVLIREVFDGTSVDLSVVNMVNAFGLVLVIFGIMRLGGFQRQGRALLISHGLGAIVLGVGGFDLPFWAFAVVIGSWGACGGIAVSMSRTIMQENAPEDQRGRVMGFFSFSFMGAGPIGAILWGLVVDSYGPQFAIVCASVAMFSVAILGCFYSRLWESNSTELQLKA